LNGTLFDLEPEQSEVVMADNSSFSVKEILQELDRSLRDWNFPVFDGGKEKPADSRLTAYRDRDRWTIVLEMVAYCPNSPGFWGIVDFAYKIGNCIPRTDTASPNYFRVVTDAPNERAFLDTIGLEANPSVRSLRIRDAVVPVDLSEDSLREKGVPLPPDGILHGEHLLWSLLPEYRDLLLATEHEKRQRLPKRLPLFMQLEQWNHPLVMTKREKPSRSETFGMLAQAIVADDPTRYLPTLPPNTQWKNWLGYDRV
jgi:hypothetical protein